MRKLLVLVTVTCIALLFTFSVREANAERVLTEQQMNTIIASCESVQAELDSLHSSDALLRVNVAQQYQNVLTSLMSPLNSRLALNQVDTVSLVTTSVEYTDALDAFRRAYSKYEVSLSAAIKMKCKNDPVAFYTAIESARKNRSAVHKRVITLNKKLTEYQQDFTSTQRAWEKSRG